MLLLLTLVVQAQSETEKKCLYAIDHARLYATYNDNLQDKWAVLIVPPDMDQKCLVTFVTSLHKKVPDHRLEFFNAQDKELDKYIAYAKGNLRGNFSVKWVEKHDVGVLHVEADPPHCPIWAFEVNLEVVAKFDRVKCSFDR